MVVLDNLYQGHREAIVSPGVELVVGDMADVPLVDALFAKHRFDSVLHFAALALVGESVAEPLRYYQNNVSAPLVVLEAMRKKRLRHLHLVLHGSDLRESFHHADGGIPNAVSPSIPMARRSSCWSAF